MPSLSTKYANSNSRVANNPYHAGPSSQSSRAACLPLAVCTIYELLKNSNFKSSNNLLGHNEKCSLFVMEYINSLSHFYPVRFLAEG